MFVEPVCTGVHTKSAAGNTPDPPLGFTVIDPVLAPLQITFCIVKLPKVIVSVGSGTVNKVSFSQPLLSFTVTR